MPLAALVGSGFFVGNFVYALVILTSHEPIQVGLYYSGKRSELLA